jgi:hypothetical protein
MNDRLKAILGSIKRSIVSLFSRFPIASIYIILQFITATFLIQAEYYETHPRQTFALILIIGSTYALIAHSIIIQFLSERFNWNEIKKYLFNLGSVIFTSAFYILILRNDILDFDTLNGAFTGSIYRLLIFIGVSVLCVFLVPFLKKYENETWWNFTLYSINKAAISVLYSVVLYSGLAIALGALQEFWDITLFKHQFELLPLFVFVLFAPLNFLSDVYNFNSKIKFELPKFLAIFGKFILTPLVIIYTAILYPYMYSFPFKSEWPSNQSTFIILAMISMIYAVMFIFWNTKEKDEHFKFIKIFTKVANLISIPTVIFWAYSMWLRIDAYKLSVNRFVVMAIILWFLFNSFYFVFSKTKDIRIVLGSLLSILILSFYFPFSAYYFSQRAQESRLISIANEQKIFVDGKIVVGEKELVVGTDDAMKNIVVYLNQFHNLKGIQLKLSTDILEKIKIDSYGFSTVIKNNYNYYNSLFFKELLPAYLGQPDRAIQYLTITLDVDSVEIPQGYTKIKTLDYMNMSDYTINKTQLTFDGHTYDLYVNAEDERFKSEPSQSFGNSSKFDSNVLYAPNAGLITFEAQDTLFLVTTMSGSFKNGLMTELQSVTGIVFIK